MHHGQEPVWKKRKESQPFPFVAILPIDTVISKPLERKGNSDLYGGTERNCRI